MSTSGTKIHRRRLYKVAVAYTLAALLAFVVSRVYNLFGHGITSPFMDWVFLFPLVGGAVMFGAAALFAPGLAARRGWRPGFNLYSAGIATMAVGSLLRGIFDIAGTASAYTV